MIHQIILCGDCPQEPGLADSLRAALPDFLIRQGDCMSGCARPQTIAFRASGKTAYLFGDLGPGDLHDLTRFGRLYQSSLDGTFADARILGALRLKAIARIPG